MRTKRQHSAEDINQAVKAMIKLVDADLAFVKVNKDDDALEDYFEERILTNAAFKQIYWQVYDVLYLHKKGFHAMEIENILHGMLLEFINRVIETLNNIE